MRPLEELLSARGLRPGDYALFFPVGEGDPLPLASAPALEETSGYLIDRAGRVFAFWLGWDPAVRRPALVEWERAEPEPGWADEPEYRDARRRVGLPA